MKEWIIFYDDGSTFSNEDGKPHEAPSLGVQAIAAEPGLWNCGDIFGLWDYLKRTDQEYSVVRFGRATAWNEDYTHAVEHARAYQDITQNRYILERGDFYWWEGSLEPKTQDK